MTTKKSQQTSSAVFFFSQKGIATNQTSRRRILSSFQPARTPELWEEWFIPTGAQRRHLVAVAGGGRWQLLVNFFHGFKKTGKWKHLEMIDWDWDWIWDWDRLESVSNYLPRPELLPRWLWVAACLDFHDIQGGNFPEFVSNRIHVVSVHIIFFAKIKNMFFPKSNQNSRNKLPWTFLHHTPIFVRPQFRCFSPLGSW